MSRYDKSNEMYEWAMENVYSKVEYAKDRIEKLSIELSNVNLNIEEWQTLDDLVVKALISLDRIVE